MNNTPRRAAVLLASLAGFSLLTACGGQRSLLAVRESGDRAYARAEYEQAQADYEEFVERLPGDPVGRYNLGRAYIRTGQPLKAREQLAVAHSQKPENDLYFEAYAESLAQAGLEEELYRVLRQRALDRQRVFDYMLLGRFAQRQGDADQAQQALITAARLDQGRSPEVQLALSDFYESIGDRESAVERLRMAYFLNPADKDVQARIRGYGEIPGPSFGRRPAELP